MIPKLKKVRGSFLCPHCSAELTKDALDRVFDTGMDPATNQQWKKVQLRPALINYSVGRATYEKSPNSQDLEIIEKISALPLPADLPIIPFPIDDMYHGSRIAPKGFTYVHHLFFPRIAHTLASFWQKSRDFQDESLTLVLRFWVDSHILNLSIQNRYRPEVSFSYNPLNGVYYVASMINEASPFIAYTNKAKRIGAAFVHQGATQGNSIISTGTASSLGIPKNTIDYIFTDPPFGSNIFYADLNFLVEAWHRVITNASAEAIVDQFKGKNILEYQSLMRACFEEYYRVLKPGRWMTIVFSNSANAVWRAIQEALGTSGFIVADVRTLDKQQGSYRQVTSSAVKQDLVISAYKPTEALSERFALGRSSPENAWAFVTEHLDHVPVFSSVDGVTEVIAERTSQVLHDRMVAFHVQRQLSVPLSTAEFLTGLDQRFPERDAMYFLSTQVAEYDRKRNTATELRQLSLFVTDEASAIQWVRRELQQKPRSFQDLQPAFMREIQNWAKHEQTVELKEILRQNCLHYDGTGPVPGQIHSYLSSNFKELRSLAKDDTALVAKAIDRWYVPDPSKQIDLEKLREKSLLSEFEAYKSLEGTQAEAVPLRSGSRGLQGGV